LRTTFITVYLYHGNITDTTDGRDPSPNVRCTHCGKLLGRAHGRIFRIANTQAPSIDELPVGLAAVELKCTACNTVHHLIWQ
jgi:phage FluMu protein Com